ncbi:MAG: ECF-type sigma factor, partial [Planctomycetota bacterium]
MDQSRFKWDANLTLWKVLATFARRKLARAIERESAIKRGGRASRTSLDHASDYKALEEYQHSSEAQDELIEDICSKLTPVQQTLLEHLLAGRSQDEIATLTGVHPRSLRRRIRELRERLAQESASSSEDAVSSFSSSVLPQIHYREFVLGKWLGAGGFAK